MLVEIGANEPSKKIRETVSFSDALATAEKTCATCKTSSPMVCVERCDVWRMKHEIFEIKKIVDNSSHKRLLLNVLKNQRRMRILQILSEHSGNVDELQRLLRQNGFSHSRSTIVEAYVKPMIEVGLVKEEATRLKTTFYGRMINSLLAEQGALELLPVHSCCYEEVVLRELETPKTFRELSTRVPQKSLSRILMRLHGKALVAERVNMDYVFYHKVKSRSKMRLSPTEKKVLDAIPEAGIAVRSLSRMVGINIRRTYKYLRRLKEKKLVIPLRTRRTYELTTKGQEIVNALNKIEKSAISSLNIPVPTAQIVS